MQSVDAAALRSYSVPRTPAPRADMPTSIESEADSARAPLLKKTALHLAFDLNDDLAALRSSLRRSRSADADAGEARDTAWLDHVLDPKGPEKLSALKLQLRDLPVRDAASLRALITGLFPDPSDAVAVLRLLLSEAEMDDIRSELTALHEELLDSRDGQGRQVRAGLNIALKARLHATPLKATAAQLRHSYREFIGSVEPLDSYTTWLELYGFERRHRVLEFIESALAADMYALDPSGSRLEFGHLLQRVRQLTTLRSADHLLMAHCWDPVTLPRMGIDAAMLLSALMTMMRRRGGIGQLLAELFARAHLALDLCDRRRLAQGLRRFLKALPHGLWTDIGVQCEAEDDVDALLARALQHERAQPAGAAWMLV